MMLSIGIALFGAGVAAYLGADAWVRIRRFERESQRPPTPPAPAALDEALATRLARIEEIVEATAIEVERVAEAQRFVARTLAERPPARLPERLPEPRSEPRPAERVVTPH